MIDLHSHTNESDGSCTPAELVEEAVRVGVNLLSITDHDTFEGYYKAIPLARGRGVQLVCGIELSTKLNGQSVHLLGYFLGAGGPSEEFRNWILDAQKSRRDRNLMLIARLQELGFDITLEEVQARSGRLITRPHFAQLMIEKGYVSTLQQAFDEYLDESATAYVDRREPSFAEGVQRVRDAGGVASLAHPVRIKADVRDLMPELCSIGLNAIEAYHSDHSPRQLNLYLGLAAQYGLLVTGGSDFHGSVKPGVLLGSGRNGNLCIPRDLVDKLRMARVGGH